MTIEYVISRAIPVARLPLDYFRVHDVKMKTLYSLSSSSVQGKGYGYFNIVKNHISNRREAGGWEAGASARANMAGRKTSGRAVSVAVTREKRGTE